VNPYELVVAVTLITSPVGMLEPTPTEEQLQELRPALLAICDEWKISSKYTSPRLNNPLIFQQDIDQLRRYYQEMLDAPAIIDFAQFPSYSEANFMLGLNLKYRERLSSQIDAEPYRDDLRERLVEIEQLRRIWAAVGNARHWRDSPFECRCHLKCLYKMIGAQDYNFGHLPPALPIWWFEESGPPHCSP
jgi:hypothetical protein